jgi:carbon monoxide dehydrogenase subunit G
VELTETFPLPVPPARAWALLDDVTVLADCIPGAELAGRQDDGSYQGRIAFTLGPKRVWFSGSVTFDNDAAALRGALHARGADAGGGSRAKGEVRWAVEPGDGPERSAVTVTAAVDFFGPLAGFAESGGTHVGRQLLTEMAACLAAKASATTPEAAGAVRAREVRGLPVLVAAIRDWLRRRVRRRERL